MEEWTLFSTPIQFQAHSICSVNIYWINDGWIHFVDNKFSGHYYRYQYVLARFSEKPRPK